MRDKRAVSGVLIAAIVALALVGCASILGNALVRVKGGGEVIRVTGSARKPIRSDFIIWKGRLAYQGANVTQAYQSLTHDMAKVKAYLMAQGIPEAEIVTSAINTTTLYARVKTPNGADAAGEDAGNATTTMRQIAGYELSEEIEVRSHNVDLVDGVSRRSTELMSSGVNFQSLPPQYLYTKISDMKVTMLAEASKNARQRAEQIAQSSGCRVGSVRGARMGVLQITPIYSTEVSGQGMNDTTSLDKDITAIVTLEFSIR